MTDKETPKHRPSLRQKILQIAADLIAKPDKIAIERSEDLVEQCKIREYLKQDGKYLDVGTGLGHIVEEVVNDEDGKNVTFLALDPIWKPLKRLMKLMKKGYADKALFMKAEGGHLPVKPHSLDGASLFFVMHHIPPEDQEKIMEEIKLVCKDDATLFLTEDVPENEDEAERNATWDRRMNFEPKGEKHYYKNNQEWLDYFDQHGFELVENIYWDEESPKKKEGLIRHRSYILKRKSQVKEIVKEGV
ncbi:class I SAM-dependent methyltransferase [Patescibacteria group bacterium]